MSEGSAAQGRPRSHSAKPPRSGEWLLLFVLPNEIAECVSGDLAEIFETVILPASGRFRAGLWYWRQVFYSMRLFFRFHANPRSTLESWKGQIKMEIPRSYGVTYHSGIRIDKIRVQGAMGLLFVFATLFIFGVGIPAVRGFAAISGALGILGAGVVYYWHKKHALKIGPLNLHESSPPVVPGDREPTAHKETQRF
jgi:hypothetical protein